jgi:hypothetical protein
MEINMHLSSKLRNFDSVIKVQVGTGFCFKDKKSKKCYFSITDAGSTCLPVNGRRMNRFLGRLFDARVDDGFHGADVATFFAMARKKCFQICSFSRSGAVMGK